MSVEEAKKILDAFFDVADYVETLHLTGGGEPFLHPGLAALVEVAMDRAGGFGRLMLFSNSTVPMSAPLQEAIGRHRRKIVVQLSRYGIAPEREAGVAKALADLGVACKVEDYRGDDQPFGGWVDFGAWKDYGRSAEERERVFRDCAVTRDMGGNWRTRDGKVHWCTRSQRGMELGLLPDVPEDYVDLFDGSPREEKRAKFARIASAPFLHACGFCSGDQGTADAKKRHPAAEQLRRA